MDIAISQTCDQCELSERVVNALAEAPIGTIRHKALLSFSSSVKKHNLDTASEDELRIWIADMILNGLKRSTMKLYFNSIHVACRAWYDFSKADPFETIRKELYSDFDFRFDEIAENLKRVRYILEKSADIKSDARETYDLFLYLLYDVNSEIKDLIEFRFDSANDMLPQIEDIADRYKGEKRIKYVFGLQQGQIRTAQSTGKILTRLSDMLADEGMKFGDGFSRDSIRELWIAAALQCGIKSEEIRGVVDTLPKGYSFLELVKPAELSEVSKKEILKKVADHINDNKKYWYAMQLRSGVTPDDVKRKLKDTDYYLRDEIRFFYPVHTVLKERGKKKAVKEDVPYLPGVLFFYLRRNDVAHLFRNHIGDEAWCYRYVNRADCPYSAISRDEMQRFQRYVGDFTEDILLEMTQQEKSLAENDLVMVYGSVMDGRICRITDVNSQNGQRKYSLILAENVAIQWTLKDIDESRLEPLTEAQKKEFEAAI